MREKKVMLITNMIGPYCTPLFNFIFEKSEFDFIVVALTEREKGREWEFNGDKIKFHYQILPGKQWYFCSKNREVASPNHFNKNVFKTLRQYNPDVVLTTGYDAIAYWQAFLYCKFANKKYILWNGTTLLSTHGMKGLRWLLKTIIVRKADKYLAYGSKAKEYLEYFGADSGDINITMNTVDMEYFRDRVFEYRSADNFLKERKKYPKILLLSVCRLVKAKGIDLILQTLAVLNNPDIGFVIVGNGPEKEYLQEFCSKNGLKNIFFEGFCQQNELPKYYALADIFVLPTLNEVWGLVVNEALASGLYVFCSKYSGAAYDLITKGINGELFDPHKGEDILAFIKQIEKNFETILTKRKDISEHACREFSIAKSGESFLCTVDSL
jgi:glycosyltransferase involved in cell wall biosynthesis